MARRQVSALPRGKKRAMKFFCAGSLFVRATERGVESLSFVCTVRAADGGGDE
jgi:hypothetical protein